MWPGANGNMPPNPGGNSMWSAPGQNPMMESQWTAHYQTMPTSQVDWAALAQQWIAMKGTDQHAPPPPPPPPAPAPPSISMPRPQNYGSMPQAPPPPHMSHHHSTPHIRPPMNNYPPQNFQNEGGMANMDLEEEEESHQNHHHFKPQFDVYHQRKPNFHHQQNFNHRPPFQPKRRFYNNHQNQQHWDDHPQHHPRSSNFHPQGDRGSQHHHPPSLFENQEQDFMEANSDLDAAAMKKLPAWIREGLEKMEREKQKKEEAEIRLKLREEKLRKQREMELKRSPQRSKFDDMTSDASDAGSDEEKVEQAPARLFVRKSRFDRESPESERDDKQQPQSSRHVR